MIVFVFMWLLSLGTLSLGPYATARNQTLPPGWGPVYCILPTALAGATSVILPALYVVYTRGGDTTTRRQQRPVQTIMVPVFLVLTGVVETVSYVLPFTTRTVTTRDCVTRCFSIS